MNDRAVGRVGSPIEAPDHAPADDLRGQSRTLEEELARGPIEPRRALALLGRVANELDAGSENPSVDLRFDDGRPGTSHHYRPPERILGRNAGPAADVYSLTALLHRCLTGQVPFPQARPRAALFWHLHAPRPRPTEAHPELPAAIDEVIARGMAPDPAARYPNADALLEHAREALGAAATRRAPERAPVAPRVDARPRSRRRVLVPLAVALGASVAAGALGFAVAGALDDPPPRSAVATAGALRLTAPPDWRPSPARESLFGVPLADPVALAPDAGEGERVIAGLAPRAATVGLLRRLRASPRGGELVALERMQARRYDRTRNAGSSLPVVLYVAPSDAGVATVACLADDVAAAGSSMARCGRVAASLRLASGRPMPAGPTGRQATALRSALGRLNAARSAYRSRLARARTATRQGSAARSLAGAHVRAARSLRSLGLTGLAQPGARAAIGALARSATAYRAAARAAARRRAAGYARARRSALAADADLRHALRSLRVVGYVR